MIPLTKRIMLNEKFLICLLSVCLIGISSVHAFASKPSNTSMSQEEYEARKKGQDQFHSLLKEGDLSAALGDMQKAEHFYLQAEKFSLGSSSEGVAKGKLARFYEAQGENEKSLKYVDWFLGRLTTGTRSWSRYTKMKQLLLQKIEEQKEWESKQNSIVPEFKSSFEKASHEEQAEVLKAFGGEGVWNAFKNAMLAEHGGDYLKARAIYEGLIPRKEEIDEQMGKDGWAMLYPAIQRTSELLGDQKREKEVLVWIKNNLLSDDGQHRRSLSKLQPEVISHIQRRIEEYQL